MIQIHWTCADVEEARRISRALVEKKLVACANILPSVESIYSWEGHIETTTEVKVYLKTSLRLFHKVEDFIVSRCSYDLPEILAFEVAEGHQPYLDWMKKE